MRRAAPGAGASAPGIALAIAAGIVAFSAREGTPRWLLPVLLILLGFLNGLCAFTMKRIGVQLERNRQALEAVAKRIGDHEIPSRPKSSATRIFEIFLALVGIGCIFAGIKLLVQRGVL